MLDLFFFLVVLPCPSFSLFGMAFALSFHIVPVYYQTSMYPSIFFFMLVGTHTHTHKWVLECSVVFVHCFTKIESYIYTSYLFSLNNIPWKSIKASWYSSLSFKRLENILWMHNLYSHFPINEQYILSRFWPLQSMLNLNIIVLMPLYTSAFNLYICVYTHKCLFANKYLLPYQFIKTGCYNSLFLFVCNIWDYYFFHILISIRFYDSFIILTV